MATEVVMPKQGNSVESCIIVDWKVSEGDTVSVGDIICEAETDKSTIDVESTAEGTVLKRLYAVDDEVLVMQPILVVGEPGEQVLTTTEKSVPEKGPAPEEKQGVPEKLPEAPVVTQPVSEQSGMGASPRARHAAAEMGIVLDSIAPTGPKGRIIERDVLKSAEGREPLSPAAREAAMNQHIAVPSSGSGIGGRIVTADLSKTAVPAPDASFPGPVSSVAVKGVRKVTARRMHESLAQTAQLTLHAQCDASQLKMLRSRLKTSDPQLGLQKISINDLVLFAVSRTLLQYPFMNSHFLGDTIETFSHVHLGFAVDTPKGLLVPVVRYADQLSLQSLSDEAKRLASLSVEGKAQSEDLTGGTFTVSNLGAMGIEYFTPVLNVPEVAILGVGGINLRPVEEEDGDVVFVPHIGLSLTIDHQAVDGAPAARFLQALCANIASIDLLMAR
jgi:pyruvate dehydrogenase E2 component (dihydrolipoamide acetyltransferase)